MKSIIRIYGLILIIIIIQSCKKEEDQPTIPVLTTQNVTAITRTTASSGGNVTSDGGAEITVKGICWGTTSNPLISGSKTTDGVGKGSFTSSLTDLNPNSMYYIRAYATNSVGTSYGNEVSFTTSPISTPTITTTNVTSITANTAISGGDITNDGGSDIFERGVCWGTTPDPNFDGSHTSDGSGIGSFASTLIDLSPGLTYYLRAFATNSVGTAYGNQVSFMTPEPQLGSFIDNRDGNEYNWIQIGNKVWMTENLAYLPYITNSILYSSVLQYFYVYGYQGTSSDEAKASDNYKVYGVIYNWNAAMDNATSSNTNPSGIQGSCPTGWHLPSMSEWKELVDYLGGEDIAGGKLKETGTSHWLPPNGGSTNSTGFTALPGGYYTRGIFHDLRGYGGWWSSEEVDSDRSRGYRTLDGYNTIRTETWYKENGLYIRCVRNN